MSRLHQTLCRLSKFIGEVNSLVQRLKQIDYELQKTTLNNNRRIILQYERRQVLNRLKSMF